MKKKKYLAIYYKWINAGKMMGVECRYHPEKTSGLCDAFRDDELFELINPTDQDVYELEKEGLNTFCWASGSSDCCFHEFTPLRQNIVLLMAAMNGEL